MNKEELENKLKDLIKRTLDVSDKTGEVFNEARDLKLQGAAVDKALADLASGKPESEVLDELEQTIGTMYAKDAEELKKEADYEQQAGEKALKQEASDETIQ
ncbi:TPA: hypothetical protein DCR79_02205 [Patescibacteria group bacterium]|nr:hypothetical protein [Patescibacteria group bacterium]